MNQLRKQEKQKLEKILEANMGLFLYFKKNLNRETESYDEDFGKIFDKEFFAEFMKKKLENVLSLNKTKLLKRLEGAKMTEAQMSEVFEESGSFGLDMLIEEFIKKMAGDKNLNEENLDTLIGMIHTRNKLQALEIRSLYEEYKIFLENKLNSYQN